MSWNPANSATSQAEIRGASSGEVPPDEEVDAVNSGDEHEENNDETENIEEVVNETRH